MGILPADKPTIESATVEGLLKAYGVTEAVALVAFRGPRGKNKRREYDDLICLKAPGFFMTFRGNCDPNGWRPGHGSGSKKGIASLPENVVHRAHIIGYHKKIKNCLIQRASKVRVLRDADKTVPKKDIVVLDGIPCYWDGPGMFGMNIHPGGIGSTSSLGCQTFHPGDWKIFQQNFLFQMGKHKQKVMPYLVTRLPKA